MDRNETQRILALISATYPNFKPENKSATVNAWQMFLEEYSYQTIANALKFFVKTDKKGFPPSVSDLIKAVDRPEELARQTPAEAWQIVRKAISRGNYYAEQDFAEFPPEIQRAVGSPSQLRTWAQDCDFNEGVESSNFLRKYNECVRQAAEVNALPAEMQALIVKTTSQMIGTAHPLAVTDKRLEIEPGIDGSEYVAKLEAIL